MNTVGNIYKIICLLDHNVVYIGSTFGEPRKRWQDHKQKYYKWLVGKGSEFSIYPYFKKHGIENFKLIKIKSYECVRVNSKDFKHLHALEQLWINKTKNTVNKISAFNPLKKHKDYGVHYRAENKEKLKVTRIRYVQENKEKIKTQLKQYRIDNKEKLGVKSKQRVKCSKCRCEVMKKTLLRHQRTLKCQNTTDILLEIDEITN